MRGSRARRPRAPPAVLTLLRSPPNSPSLCSLPRARAFPFSRFPVSPASLRARHHAGARREQRDREEKGGGREGGATNCHARFCVSLIPAAVAPGRRARNARASPRDPRVGGEGKRRRAFRSLRAPWRTDAASESRVRGRRSQRDDGDASCCAAVGGNGKSCEERHVEAVAPRTPVRSRACL